MLTLRGHQKESAMKRNFKATWVLFAFVLLLFVSGHCGQVQGPERARETLLAMELVPQL